MQSKKNGLVGVYGVFRENLSRFQTKLRKFPHSISDLTLKLMFVFRTTALNQAVVLKTNINFRARFS